LLLEEQSGLVPPGYSPFQGRVVLFELAVMLDLIGLSGRIGAKSAAYSSALFSQLLGDRAQLHVTPEDQPDVALNQ